MTYDVFLDRDGTLIRDTGYISKSSDVEVLFGVFEGLKLFKERGYRLHIVSNQSGVPRGKISKLEFKEVESFINKTFRTKGILFDTHNYCFHLSTDGCKCRKPNSGLFEQVSEKYEIDKVKSAMLGNSDVDSEAAKSFGISFWEVGTPRKNFYQIAREVVEYFEGL
jgi:D-glycero-D-manno-heptose 1,7-bisphosphate phosphatase